MIMKHVDWDFVFTFDENVIQWLVIEEPVVFREFVFDLKRQCQGESGGFVLSENDKPISIPSRLALLTDPFSVEINSRKAITSLHKCIGSIAVNEEHYLKTQETVSGIFQYLEELFSEFQCPLTLDYETGVDKLLKAFNVGVDTEESSFPELFLDFANVLTDFCGIRVFVFCNLSSCLTSAELCALIASWHSAKIPVLLIDTVAPNLDLDMNRWVIDKDKCLILG